MSKVYLLNGEAQELAGAIEAAGYRRAESNDESLDLAINISMPSGEDVCSIAQQTGEGFDRITQKLLGNVFQRMQEQLPAIARSGGAIVNIVSMLALEGRAGCAPIAASEHAIVGLSQCAARTYAGRASINVLCVTRHFANNQAEIASVILGLASMKQISGQMIMLDGGLASAYQ